MRGSFEVTNRAFRTEPPIFWNDCQPTGRGPSESARSAPSGISRRKPNQASRSDNAHHTSSPTFALGWRSENSSCKVRRAITRMLPYHSHAIKGQYLRSGDGTLLLLERQGLVKPPLIDRRESLPDGVVGDAFLNESEENGYRSSLMGACSRSPQIS